MFMLCTSDRTWQVPVSQGWNVLVSKTCCTQPNCMSLHGQDWNKKYVSKFIIRFFYLLLWNIISVDEVIKKIWLKLIL